MKKAVEESLASWVAAGLIDNGASDRIRGWEAARAPEGQVRWGAAIAWGLGALLIGAGVVSFVASNWDAMSPWSRMSLILLMTVGFHVAAGLAEKVPALRMALHGVGTVCLGAGISLTAQVFHLSGKWNGWMLLWSLGAAVGYWLIRDWLQLLLLAILLPLWVAAEWDVRFQPHSNYLPQLGLWLGLSALYFLSQHRPLVWLGAIGLIPATIFIFVFSDQTRIVGNSRVDYLAFAVVMVAMGALAWRIAGGFDAKLFATVAMVAILSLVATSEGKWTIYPLVAIAYGAMISWGVTEQRVELVIAGVAGFAITVLGFYLSHALTLLGSSAGLIVFGILLVGGGFVLEKARRGLVARAEGGGQ